MQININSDNHVEVHQETVQQWQEEIAATLDRFDDWITRVEVHLTDQNSQAKGGPDDIRCLMEARLADQKPVSVEVREASVGQAIQEGARTLQRRVGTIVDKARDQKRKRPAQ